jgi:hypothetical protein
MRYYIVTTTKFADECLEYLTYGATQSNWLANIDVGDTIFLSQFNYKSQNLFGPLQVTKDLFYNKDIIYPQQKYFYRIQFKLIETIKTIEETDLYLNGIRSEKLIFYSRIINLIQQNKHLHCISLTEHEGEAILNTFQQLGSKYHNDIEVRELREDLIDIHCSYIWDKNKLDKRRYFSSESDLESYIIFSLRNAKSEEYKCLAKLLNKYKSNDLQFSEIYNQFIFGNAYPSDIVILNKDNINVFELKKDKLANNIIPQIEKEIKKHLYYSLFSERIKSDKNLKRFNFFLVYLKDSGNSQHKRLIFEKYNDLCKKVAALRENTLTFVEYYVKDNILVLEEVR